MVSKVTVCLPDELLRFADDSAQRQRTSRSAFIARLLKKEAELEEELLMAQGYIAMARERQAFAESAVPLASEMLPPWE